VDDSVKQPKFMMSSNAVGLQFFAENLEDYTRYVEYLVRRIPVLIYAGEFDEKDGPSTIQPWLKRL